MEIIDSYQVPKGFGEPAGTDNNSIVIGRFIFHLALLPLTSLFYSVFGVLSSHQYTSHIYAQLRMYSCYAQFTRYWQVLASIRASFSGLLHFLFWPPFSVYGPCERAGGRTRQFLYICARLLLVSY